MLVGKGHQVGKPNVWTQKTLKTMNEGGAVAEKRSWAKNVLLSMRSVRTYNHGIGARGKKREVFRERK